MSETVDIIVREQGAEQAAQNIEKVGEASDHAAHQVHELEQASEKLNTVLEALGLALTANKLIEYADTYTSLINKLQQVTSSTHELAHVEQELFEISQQTRAGFEGTISLYAGLTKATQGLQLSSKDLMEVTKTINEGIKLEGKSSEEASGALRMFAFQLNQGELSGRGLRTMLVQFPTLARALAASLNVSSGALMEMGTRGELSSKKVIEAFQRIAPEVSKQFNKMQVTIHEAFHELEEAVMRQIGMANQSSGATMLIASAMQFLAHHIEITMGVVGTLTTFLTVFTTGLLLTSKAAGTLWAVFAANPLLLTISVVAALISLFVKFGDQIMLTSDGSVSALGAIVGIVKVLGDWLGQLYKWLTTTETGFQTLMFAAAATGAYLLVTFGGRVLVAVIEGLALLSAGLARVAIALGAMLLSPLGLAIGAFVAAAVAVAYFTGTLDKLVEKIKEVGGKALDQLTEKVKKVSAEMKQSALESDNMAGRTGSAFDNISNGAGKMGASVASGAKAASDGLKNAFDDPNWGLKAYQKKMDELAAAAAKDFDEITRRNKEMSDAIVRDQNALRNALGQTITVTDEWARRSGAAFNKVADSAQSSSRSTQSSLESSAGGYVKWATDAEEAADRVIRANNDAAAAARQNSSPSGGGGGGGGGSSGSFSFVSDVPAFLKYQAALEQKEFADVRAAYEAANQQVGAARDAALANASLMGTNADSKWKDFDRGWGAGWQVRAHFAQGGSFNVGGQGGTDSQLVQFMASPDETVTVSTPQDRKDARSNARPHVINMPITIVTADVGSFKRSEKQFHQTLLGKLGRAQASLSSR